MPTLLVHIIRHGKARAESASGLDRDRDLQPRGERQGVWLGERLAREPRPPAIIISSPFVRARRTAELIAEALHRHHPRRKGGSDGAGRPPPHAAIVFDPRLEVGCDPSCAAEIIAEHAGAGSLAIVGHNPQLELLIGALVCGPGGGSRAHLRTGECYVLHADDPAAMAGGLMIAARWRLEEDD